LGRERDDATASDAASVAEAVDACLFGLTLSFADVRATALRGIVTLAQRGVDLPRRDALAHSIRAALSDSDDAVLAAARDAARALQLG
jgi:hypothetical protein